MRWKTSFQVSATYVGAVMGAGFASGQEIQQFFTRFGHLGLIGISISSLFFALMGWGMLDLQNRWRITSYNDFFEGLLGKRLGLWADRLVSMLLFVGMLAMVSGSGALFQEYFGFTRWIGILLTCFVIVLALWYQGEGVLWINSVLIPLKFVFCLGIAAAAIFLVSSGDGCPIVQSTNPIVSNWILSAILYVSFNLTLALVVFASLGRDVQKPGARLGGVLGGVALGLFALSIGGALLRFPDVLGLEIPMVGIAGKLGEWPAFFYVVVLWLAMITAAVGNGFSLISRIVDSGGLSYGKATSAILLLLIPMAGVRFSQIVQLIYPLFGYIGLLFMPTIVYCWLKR
ncbi:putative membrane protein [Desulfosporosinus orientis DSM 765]|uniref:Putative membrane protein n=1 Tax=Desulfosporosinus orientis (strain ATCC 19365 / DSM 765 / NCIMB 8382 / VKM B-1628 / Singapore I) TaxID=768706 RepID=G7WI70_DESOD|nr:membrane protein [Desulfosporosinus orientis]AET70993.1 putative membrane protein [Desulfosporosinus orientis DSM 765]